MFSKRRRGRQQGIMATKTSIQATRDTCLVQHTTKNTKDRAKHCTETSYRKQIPARTKSTQRTRQQKGCDQNIDLRVPTEKLFRLSQGRSCQKQANKQQQQQTNKQPNNHKPTSPYKTPDDAPAAACWSWRSTRARTTSPAATDTPCPCCTGSG